MKAQFVKREYDHINHHPIYTYQYRGFEYEVIDFGWNGTPLRWQHELEQAHIDEEIDKSNKPKNPAFVATSAQEGLDLFWAIVNGEEVYK